MDLSYDEIERYIEIICSGIYLTTIDNKDIFFRYPTNEQRVKARLVYSKDYSDALRSGLLTYDKMSELLNRRKLINNDDRVKCDKLKKEIEAQKVLLSKTTRVKARQDRIKAIIENKTKELNEIENKEKSKYGMTAETRAEESRILYLCWCCTYDFLTNCLLWETKKHFDDDRDILFRKEVISSFIHFYTGIPTSIIRCIARSSMWRIRYLSSVRFNEHLFNIPVVNYDHNQTNLVYWSQYYQNIYEMMPEDRPSENIIEDDDALDAFMQAYYDDIQNEAASRRDRKGNKSRFSSGFDKEEIIVTRTNELYDDIKFDEPREAKAFKDAIIVNKKTRRG